MRPRLWLTLLLALLWAVGARAGEDAASESAGAILDQALERRFGCDLLGRVAIRVDGRSGEPLERELTLASKSIGGRLHSLARFTGPEYLRGSALLSIERETPQASDDHYLYLRTLGRVRRISSAQRGDAFLGSDLSYEDFERRHGADYEASFSEVDLPMSEPVRWIEARPHFASGYERISFAIASSDRAILATRYFRGAADAPYKELRAAREGIRAAGGCRIPTRLVIENRQRGTTTRVAIEDLQIGAVLDDGLFSSASLESGRAIEASGVDDSSTGP